MQSNRTRLVRHQRLITVTEHLARALFILTQHGEVVGAKHHVLRRDRNRLTVRRFEQVVGREHQEPRFSLCLGRKWDMHRHLVAIEVRIIRSTDQRMQFERTSFDEHRLERLDS